jgi:hypothetical protein
MEVQQTNKRVRINFSETAKGLWQIDCTAENEELKDALELSEKALLGAKAILAKNHLKEVGNE